MAETVRIEIPIETVDNTDPELSKVVQNLNKMKDAADKANTSTKRAGDTVSKFDKSAQKTQKSLSSWAKEKYQILIEAKDKLSPVITTLGSSLKSFAGKTWSVTIKAIDLVTTPVRSIINLLKNPIFQVGAVLGVSVTLKDTIDTYSTFEATMSKVKALSNATDAQMVKLTQTAKEMGAKTRYSGTESAEAFTYMAQAGWEIDDMISGIGGIMSLAASDGIELAEATDIVANALTSFNMTAKDTAQFADVLAVASSATNTNVSELGEAFKYIAPTAGALGYTIEDVSLALGLMSNNAVKGSMAGTSLKTSLANMAAPTDEMASLMKQYGISLTDSHGNAKSLKLVLDNLRESLGNLSETEQTAVASTIFGKEAMSGMLSIINATDESYAKLTEQINNAEGAADSMAETMQDNLAGAFEQLGGAVETVQLTLGERMEPYLLSLSRWLEGKMPDIEDAANEVFDRIDKHIDSLRAKIKDMTATSEWQDADFFKKTKIAWDKFIAEPFSEWWKNKGKAKFSDFAQDIGEGIGTGLKLGIMTLLGIDISETIDEGVSIGASFAKGFSEGFDFEAVSDKLWQGFSNLLSNASKLLPGGESADLASVFSMLMLSKIAIPFMSIGKGAFGLGKTIFGTGSAGTSLAGSFLGSAATGSGLLGKSALFAIDLGAGNLAGGASMSTGALAATGMAAGAGGVAAGATLISAGIDTYKAIKSDDKAEKSAYGESAAWKAGGVAAGAAAGAALGSIIPGLGTAVGSLVGAGVGGIAGWIKGNKVKEEYQENVEEMEREAERIKRIYEVTGLSVDKVRFANKDLNEALKDTNLSAEELASFIQEDMAKVAESAFGDITLSLTEIKNLAQEITFGKSIESVTEFAKASETVSTDLAGLKTIISDLKKENWKASLGMELSETERDDYKTAIDNFAEAASQYIDDNHYQATVALKLINGDGADTTGLDNMYSGMKSQIDDLTAQLSDKVTIALQDGVIQLDEQDEILNLQQQIEDITSKLSSAQEEASLDVLKIKYGSGSGLSVESFTQMQEELKAQVESWTENYDSALEITLTNLKLQLSEGAITQEEYDAAVKEATDGYTAQMNEMNVRVRNFNLETIAGAWEEQLNGILPDFEGSLSEKLSAAMNYALLIQPDASKWTEEDVMKWFDLDGIAAADYSSFGNIYAELKATAEQAPQGVKDEIIQNYKDSIPTAEEIYNAIDWSSFSYYDFIKYSTPTYSINPEDYANEADFLNALHNTEQKNMNEFAKIYSEDSKIAEEAMRDVAQNIHDTLETELDSDTVSEFVNTYMTGVSSDIEQYGNSLTNEITSSIAESMSIIREVAENAVTSAYSETFEVTANINVKPIVSLTGASPVSLTGTLPYGELVDIASNHAGGGYVSGGPQLSWLAEEGYGEFIIPTNPSRRSRALDLYKQAGIALGVSAHAEGGYVGNSKFSSNLASNITGYNLFSEAIKNAPIGNYEATGDNTEDNPITFEPVSVQSAQSGGNSIQVPVSVSVSPQFVIEGSGGKSEEDIMAIIRKNMKAMADELGGEIADRLEQVFSNMPTVKEA